MTTNNVQPDGDAGIGSLPWAMWLETEMLDAYNANRVLAGNLDDLLALAGIYEVWRILGFSSLEEMLVKRCAMPPDAIDGIG